MSNLILFALGGFLGTTIAIAFFLLSFFRHAAPPRNRVRRPEDTGDQAISGWNPYVDDADWWKRGAA
jgi:hypothetical protein